MKRLYFLLAVLVISCAPKNNATQTNGVPAWFTQVQAPSASYIYGTGSSKLKEDATNIALSNALAQIKTTVSSTVGSQASIVNNKTSEEMTVRVINEVERFALDGYETTKLEYDSKTKTYYSEVRINKLDIYTKKLAEYQTEMQSVENAKQNANNGTLLTKLDFAKTLSKKADSMQADASVLYALNKSFPYKAELDKISGYRSYRSELLGELRFDTSKIEAKPELAAINSAITAKKLRTGSGDKRDIIYVGFTKQDETSTGKVYGMNFAKTTGLVTLMDGSGEILKQKTITYGATSTISDSEAYKESLKDLTKQFSGMLDEILG